MEFQIKDIIDYEINNNVSILEELSFCNLDAILDVIKMGYKCSDEEAENILDKELKDKEITDYVKELVYKVIGKEPEENESTINNTEMKSFSDILEDFYSEVQTVDKNLTLSEFQGMSTRYLYKYAEGVRKRYVFNKNEELKSQFTNVAMFMQALSGKLKECPQLNGDGTVHKKSLEEKIRALKGGC
jgi:hypothetical protein